MSEKIDDFTIFNTNPFFNEIRENDIIQSKDSKVSIPTNLSIKDSKGNFISPAFIKKNYRKFMDVRQFARLPIDGLMTISSLEKPELKIFCYILTFVEQNSLEIELPADKIRKYFKYRSRNPIYKGLTGLLSKQLIARKNTSKAIYFINPMFFYKGNIATSFLDYLSKSNLKSIKESNDDIKENKEFYNIGETG